METGLPMCVLICLDGYLGLKKQKLVTNKQKVADVVPKNHKNPTLLFEVMHDGDWSASVSFDLFSCLSWSEET